MADTAEQGVILSPSIEKVSPIVQCFNSIWRNHFLFRVGALGHRVGVFALPCRRQAGGGVVAPGPPESVECRACVGDCHAGRRVFAVVLGFVGDFVAHIGAAPVLVGCSHFGCGGDGSECSACGFAYNIFSVLDSGVHPGGTQGGCAGVAAYILCVFEEDGSVADSSVG